MESTVIDVHGAYAESSRRNPVLDVRVGDPDDVRPRRMPLT